MLNIVNRSQRLFVFSNLWSSNQFTMKTKSLTMMLILLAGSLALLAQVPNKSSLDIKEIMSDRYDHSPPGQLNWSDDSKTLWFNWNPDRKRSGSMYRIDPKNPVPVVASSDERPNRTPDQGVYNAGKTMKLLMNRQGLQLINLKKADTLLLLSVTNRISSYEFSHSGEKVVFTLDNNLFWINLKNGQFRQLTNFQSSPPPARERSTENLNDQDRWLLQDQLRLFPKLASQRGRGDFRGWSGMGGAQGGAAAGPKPIFTEGFSVSQIQLTPDEQYVTFVQSWPAEERSKQTIMPDYVTRSGYTEPRDTRSKVGNLPGRTNLGIIALSDDRFFQMQTDSIPGITDLPDYAADYPERYRDQTPTARPIYLYGPSWSPNGKYGVVGARSADNKDLWLLLLNPADGSVRLLDRQRDEAWIGGPGVGYGANINWMDDGERFWFQSEASGYSHLYMLYVASGEKKALTAGNFEVYDPFLSANKKYWYFTSNEVHPGEHHFYRMPLEGGERVQLTSLCGDNEVTLSPDEKWMAIRFSSANRPTELYLQQCAPGAEAVQITDSRTDEMKAYPWRMPEFVTFKAADGASVYARLYKPDPAVNNRAAVIFVHGAGYLQNAHKWWSTYEHEYMFHNLLADNGYTILDIDYRGSAGYGRDWRTGIYRHMGGKDLSDQVDGARFLISDHGVDPLKIGIYGGSYGGFITLMAMFNAPDVFSAGAALRSVTDWAHYNHGYTANILNTPVEDSLAYARSSPINFAEGLKGQLLMCHGVLDDNVHFQDIVRLSQRLIDLGKENWELAIYPLERHSFTDPDAWTDEYRRIFKLFQTTLN